jgi:predicted enzyme related to lactoylglutathione lyase
LAKKIMAKITGIGGIFFKSTAPVALRNWYKEQLHFDIHEWGGSSFFWRDNDQPELKGRTEWSIMDAASTYMGKPEQQFMINYRVDNLDELLAELAEKGVEQIGETDVQPYGKFAWVLDGDGNRIELWEPQEDGF